MTNEIAPLTDPGLPEHIHRKADVDPKAAKKAEHHRLPIERKAEA